MRIIKLSRKQFSDFDSFYEFIRNELPAREPVGMFRIPKGYISKTGIQPEEWVLFVMDAVVIGFAKCVSKVEIDAQNIADEFSRYILLDINSFSQSHVKLGDIERSLIDHGLKANLLKTQGWPHLENEHELLALNELRRLQQVKG